MPDLKDLADKREDILLAELAAWLHDIGKLSKEFIDKHSLSPPANLDRWHHELVLRRRVRKIEKDLGKSYEEATKEDIRQWIERKFHISIPPTKGGRPFPNPHKKEFPNKLDTYLNRDPKSGNSDVIERIREYFRILVLERVIDSSFLANNFYEFCELNDFTILNQSAAVAEVIEGHGDPIDSKKPLVKLFKPPSCDAIDSAIDKGMAEKTQKINKSYVASAFGYERKIKIDKLASVRYYIPTTLSQIRKLIPYILYLALGETRRAANDVTLADHSWSVAALYKSLLVRLLLQEEQVPDISRFLDEYGRWDERAWRLLSIRTDGLEYMLSSSSIPDLLARKELLTHAWNRIQKLLEKEYPLGLEVYRDENGPVFVVPDLENLLSLTNSADNNKTLRKYILEAFHQGTVKNNPCLAIDGEVGPRLEISKAWSGQKDPGTGELDLPPIGDILKIVPPLQTDPLAIAPGWYNLSKPEEICTICGLRPQGPSPKAKRRKMCDVCEQRRADRAKAWAEGSSLSSEDRFKQDKPDTVWSDEVADANGRLALIVGHFDLTHWQNGTLVRSLAVRTPNDQNGHIDDKVAKNPSFARLRRIWETTRRFWQEVAPTDVPPKELQDFCQENGLKLEDLWEKPLSLEDSVAGVAISEKRSRLFLKAQNANDLAKDQRLGPFHAYEMQVQGRKIAVLWVPPEGLDVEEIPEEYRGGFWIIENLAYLDRVFGQEFRKLLQPKGKFTIYEPSEYARPGKPKARLRVEDIQEVRDTYTPLIPIIAEPRTFMALVPADKALEVVRAIKTKYEREMGKVRNRLPLHLGLVFADSHQPLRTILDAGRRMLRQKAEPLIWKIVCPARKQVEKGDYLPSSYREDQEKQFKEWYEILLESLEDKNQKLTWYVPAKMGDGQTEDFWYPFAFLKQKEEPKDRKIYYQARNPWNEIHSWLVHVSKLQPGDVIYFTPATFDFIWLDHSGRRFEIAYNETGRRLGTLRRPYLLDELEELIACWKLLTGDWEKKIKRLGTSQLHEVRDLIEAKRAEWFENPEDSLKDNAFRAFCESVLKNAEWGNKPQEHEFKRLTHWAVTGLLADTVELFYHILKQRPGGKKDETTEGGDSA